MSKITIRTDIKSKNDATGKWGYWGKKSESSDPMDVEDLMDKMEELDYMGLHEVLDGDMYRPYADLDWSEGITKDNFEVKKYEILKKGYELMDTAFPGGEVQLFCSSGQKPDGSWKVSGHFIVTGHYYEQKAYIKHILTKHLGDPSTWKAQGWDAGVYNKSHLFRLPYCTKPGDKRKLRFAELKSIGDVNFVSYGNMQGDKMVDFEMDDGLICCGLITYIDSDEEKMPKPDDYVEMVKDFALKNGKNEVFTDEQKAARFENMKKVIAALAPHRANDRTTWTEGLWAIRRCAHKVGQDEEYRPLAHIFAKKTDGGNYNEVETNKIYSADVREIGVGYKRLTDWADVDTPGWNAVLDFTITAGAEFDIEKIKEKIKSVKTPKQFALFKDAVVEYMNNFCTLVKAGRKPYIIWEVIQLNVKTKEEEATQDYKDVTALRTDFANKTMLYNISDKKDAEPEVFCPLKCWLQHPKRNEKERVYFNPNPKINDPRAYNIFKGLAIQYKDCKDAPALKPDNPWLQHIAKRWCGGNLKLYNNVLDRFALQIQQPWIKHGVGQGLMSPEGSGKGIVLQPIFRIIGKKYVAFPATSDSVIGKFNALLMGKLVVFLDELTWGGDKEREGALKRLTTEETVGLERKGIDPVEVDNPANVIACSNEDWMLPASRKARRFQVMRLSEELAGNHTDETEQLIKEITDVSDLSIAKFFYERDITGFNPKKIIATDALRSQKIESMGPIDQVCLSMLNRGVVKLNGVEQSISNRLFVKADFYESVGASLKYMNDSKFWKHLQTLWPSLTFSRPTEGKKRVMKVQFPDLEVMRAEFRKAYDDPEWAFDDADEVDEDAMDDA